MSATAAIELAVLCATIIGEVVKVVQEALKSEPVPSADELRKTLVDAITARTDDHLRKALAEANAEFDKAKE